MVSVAQPSWSLEGIDDASAALILELQLADIDTLQAQMTGKQREGTHTDAEFALLMTCENLKTLRSTISDRRMTQSIANAVQQDGNLVAAAVLEEEVAHGDRAFARRLNGNRVIPQDQAQVQRETLDDILLAKLAGLYLSEEKGIELFDPCEEQHEIGESSTRQTQSGIGRKPINRQCIACGDTKKYFDVISGPCGHEYCRDCLRALFELSFTDESLFPPRCCRRPIPVTSVEIFLTKSIKQRFEERNIECGTPNRTYCSNSRCSRFIKADEIEGDIATCTSCGTTTCTVCKAAGHVGECPHDTALHAVVDLANTENWQRCYSCRSIVQLEVGCNHITCRCGAQFCYLCGLVWKTCGCAQWDEQNLLARANIIVDRGPERRRVDDRVERVEAAVEMLRERHDCVHQNWRYVHGPNNCEECHQRLPRYIFECGQCRIRACNRCKNNRML